jgi:hypothetical protein
VPQPLFAKLTTPISHWPPAPGWRCHRSPCAPRPSTRTAVPRHSPVSRDLSQYHWDRRRRAGGRPLPGLVLLRAGPCLSPPAGITG